VYALPRKHTLSIDVAVFLSILPPYSATPTLAYPKSGGIGLYSAIVALLPDYAFGFTVLAAGAASQSNIKIISYIMS
jgi:hypothetical protein